MGIEGWQGLQLHLRCAAMQLRILRLIMHTTKVVSAAHQHT